MTLGECQPGYTGYITDSGRVHRATIFKDQKGELGADCGGFVLRINQTSLTGLRDIFATPREATDVLIARLNAECAELEAGIPA